jgi:hypothetical protein
VHPRNPDAVYVAALGHAFGPNRTRGVYRSKDGGATWEQAYDVFADLAARIDCQLEGWQQLLAGDVATFNTLIRNADVPAVVP